jgi:hypothetical protein
VGGVRGQEEVAASRVVMVMGVETLMSVVGGRCSTYISCDELRVGQNNLYD